MTEALIGFFFLSLQISSSPAAGDQMNGSAGGDFSGFCGSSFSGTRKIFCRENCGEGNVLVETKEDSAANGRYSIEYVRGQVPNIYSLLVKISGLTGSDSGRYRCGLGESYQDFTLSVSGVSTSSTSTATHPWSLNSSSESFTPSASSASSNQPVSHGEEKTPDETSAGRLLAVVLTGAGILLSAALLVFCRRRRQNLLTGVKTTRGLDRSDQKDPDYENDSSGDLIYMNAKPVCRNKK
ncbi:uncharacterized protein LOC129352908 [Poeciliopsis prolifica]|uniref:uncharacterized protein LOC129352908 n=1 Tax=Poeciliopsis prolifica TaxID=188132 RepID=UPI0024145F41|nr:uncharacterized protein LOC129352908 [Poeciliopsis prolifica]